MSINPSKIRIGEIVHFTVDLLNFGTEDLINLNTNIDIKGPNGDVLESNPTTTISLLTPGSRDQLKSYWKSDGYPAGEYSAEAKIDYGGTYLAEPKIKIRVGDILINILNVTTQLNESIGKVFISVESNWNDLIKDVYAEIIIRNGSKVIDRIKTSSINMEPWSRKILTAFWERRALPAGEYELETIVYYEDKQSNKIIKVDLPELTDLPSPAKIDSVLLIVVVSFLVLILIINLVWFFFNLKEKKQGKKRNKK